MCTLGSCPVAPRANRPHANLFMMCTACFFLMFKHWFCRKYQYNKYMFNFIDIYSFIPVSGCVDMGPSALLFPGGYNAVKTAFCCFFTKHTSLKGKNKDWLARSRDNVSEWSDVSTHRILFQWASTIQTRQNALV